VYLKELQEENPQLKRSLSNHTIPPELIEGNCDDDYLLFLKKRADSIFQIIQANVTNSIKDIRSEFYHEARVALEHEKINIF
jgi:hypothetical protein